MDRIDCSEGHSSGNCVIACVNCNRQRRDTIMKKFYRKKALLRFAKTHPMIHLIDKANKRVFYKIKSNIVGGPSIVYHRYHEKDVTEINRLHYNQEENEWFYNSEGKTVNTIVGFDANALYLYCLGQEMLCGKLEWIPTKEEYKVEYENETKELSESEKEEYKNERQLSEKSKKLQKKISKLNTLTWLEFLDSFFGIVELDIEIPQDKYEYFGEMPPIFKNLEYSEEEGGEYMKKVILGKKEKCVKTRKLIASLKATMLLISYTKLKLLI